MVTSLDYNSIDFLLVKYPTRTAMLQRAPSETQPQNTDPLEFGYLDIINYNNLLKSSASSILQ